MKTKFFRTLFVILSIGFGLSANAQERIIRGVVTTFDSIPMMNVKIKVQSSRQTVLTDSLGSFSVTTRPEDRLTVSANGFYNQKVKLNEQTKYAAINLRMKPGEKNREYAIGYAHVSDKDKLNALANLSNDDLDFSQYNTIYDLITGRFAGVQVMNGEVIIRGQNSFSSSNAALIVVDGIPTDGSVLQTIPPVQVKSINVIKDGSSAIYGVRGANGVVIIETRRGEN